MTDRPALESALEFATRIAGNFNLDKTIVSSLRIDIEADRAAVRADERAKVRRRVLKKCSDLCHQHGQSAAWYIENLPGFPKGDDDAK